MDFPGSIKAFCFPRWSVDLFRESRSCRNAVVSLGRLGPLARAVLVSVPERPAVFRTHVTCMRGQRVVAQGAVIRAGADGIHLLLRKDTANGG